MEKISMKFNFYWRFYLLWSCGCVFNEKIIKDLGIKDKKCPLCTKPYVKGDIVEYFK